MKKESELQDSIAFRPVYLSDLKRVREMYWNNEADQGTSATRLKEHREIAMNFGIPLHVAEQNGEVIAYSFLSLNANSKAALHVFADKGCSVPDIRNRLTTFSSKSNANTYLDGTTFETSPIERIENSIKTLVDWLNKCIPAQR